MIPQSVYTHIMLATNVNHGAELVRGRKTWFLENNGGVKATLFIRPESDNKLPALAKRGFETSPTSGPHKALAWKDIPLGLVPTSTDDEWKKWDEY